MRAAGQDVSVAGLGRGERLVSEPHVVHRGGNGHGDLESAGRCRASVGGGAGLIGKGEQQGGGGDGGEMG